VLGVEARVDNAGVTLSWQRRARSGYVVVVRHRGAQGHGVVSGGEWRATATRRPAVHRLPLHDRQLRRLGVAAHGEPRPRRSPARTPPRDRPASIMRRTESPAREATGRRSSSLTDSDLRAARRQADVYGAIPMLLPSLAAW
jgi:hypothetical protein